MELLLNRQFETELSTIGTLALNGVTQCFVLELPWRDNQPDISRIPAGTYGVQLLPSKKFNRIMPHLIDVPNRSEIEIHWGNAPQDTDGCILVGSSRGTDYVYHSVETFSELFPQLQAAADASEAISITIVDPDGSASFPNA